MSFAFFRLATLVGLVLAFCLNSWAMTLPTCEEATSSAEARAAAHELIKKQIDVIGVELAEINRGIADTTRMYERGELSRESYEQTMELFVKLAKDVQARVQRLAALNNCLAAD